MSGTTRQLTPAALNSVDVTIEYDLKTIILNWANYVPYRTENVFVNVKKGTETVISGEYSVGREVKVADIQMQNAIGETSVAVTAACAQTTYAVENGYFVPEYAGEYTIEYLCTDYSETCKVSYTIIVAENDTPIFLTDISMPEYFIVGAPYQLPTAKCRVYRNNAMFDVVPAIEVYYSSLNQRVTVKDGAFTPTAQGDIIIYGVCVW